MTSQFSVERGQSKFISKFSESKLNSGSRDEYEMILKQNVGVLVLKHIGTISFVFHFCEQIRSTSQRRPCVCFLGPAQHLNTTLKGHRNRGFNQIQKCFRPNASNNKWISFSRNTLMDIGKLMSAVLKPYAVLRNVKLSLPCQMFHMKHVRFKYHELA